MGMFRNPMLIMMIFSAGLMYMMPKMMEGLDDEQKAQMQKQMAMQSDPQAMLSELFGGGGGDGDQDKKSKLEARADRSVGGGQSSASRRRRGKRD